jgi:S1-C subfamily serine protease
MARFITHLRNRLLVAAAALCLAVTGRAAANPEVAQKLEQRTTWVLAGDSMGSGVLVNAQRKRVVTAYHVVDEAERVEVFFPLYVNGELLNEPAAYRKPDVRAKFARKGRVVARNRAADLAVIELDSIPEGVTAVSLADRSPRKGETVHYIGNSGLGMGGAMWRYTQGTVRNVYRHQWKAKGPDGGKVYAFHCLMVEVQSATNGGDSGGPMVNDRGELVGIVSGGNPNQTAVNFSIDVREIRALLASVSDHVPPAPAVTPAAPSGALTGLWKRADLGTSTTRHTWEFRADGTSLDFMDFGSGTGIRKEGTYRFADGVLTVTEKGKDDRYRVEFTGAGKMRLTFIENGYQTTWELEGPAAPLGPFVPNPFVPAPPAPLFPPVLDPLAPPLFPMTPEPLFPSLPKFPPVAPAETVSLTGAWEAQVDGAAVVFYFMTNGKYLFITHKDRVIDIQVEGSYRFENGTLHMELPNGKKMSARVEVPGPGRITFIDPQQPNVRDTLTKVVGDLTLETRTGGTITLSGK